MILALLIGCLTPERFAAEWAPTMCAAAEECGEVIDGLDCDTVIFLPECDRPWDATEAQSCLDAVADTCGGEVPAECSGILDCE